MPLKNQHSKISVVIPYFQMERGILRKSVTSVLKQTGNLNYEIIIIDDGSPVSAEEEIGDLLQKTSTLSIIKQKNAGPGAARNTGIDNVSKDTTYIAFLDSDDCWLENHLENAIDALGRGYDFYFSDFFFADYKEESAFERAEKIQRKNHKCLNEETELYEYTESMMDQILIKGNVIGTPTVVYNHKKFSHLRFRPEFYHNGEDYLFWLDYAQTGGSIAVSFQKECDCGTGLNIYAGAGWGTERSLQRLQSELFTWKSINNIYSLSDVQQKSLQHKIGSIRESVGRDIIHRLVKCRPIKPDILMSIVKTDVLSLLNIPVLIISIIMKNIISPRKS